MPVKTKKGIETYTLDSSFHRIHKAGIPNSDFGLDNTAALIEGGFGLYSSAGLKPKIGPIKSEFYRLGFGIRGSVLLHCGLESFQFQAADMVFTFPGQVFSLSDRSPDFFAWYILFKEEFLGNLISAKDLREQFPFFNYSGVQHLHLNHPETAEIEHIILKINAEIKGGQTDMGQVIKLYLHLLLTTAKRSYTRQGLETPGDSGAAGLLLRKFKKLASRDFIQKRSVSEYAEMLHVTPDHLSKTLRAQTGKTARDLIDDMLLLEAKALLLHTELSVAEISWRLEFSDPSHFNKFFKKHTRQTPLSYRNKP